MLRLSLKVLVGLLLLLPMLAGCGGRATPTPIVVVVTPPPPQTEPATEVPQPPPAAEGIELVEAVFAHGLSEEMEPLDPGADFEPSETVYLSLRIKERPEEGQVSARFFWGDDLIAEASVDLADVNSGLIFSVGEDTYVGYTLTHEDPFPLSDGYRAEVSYGDQDLGSYPFRVVPPAEAIPSLVRELVLALGADEDYNPVEPTTTFATDETVYAVGRGDLGTATWLQADWYVGGQLDETGTRSITVEENAADVGFAFSFLPDGGWPEGEHFVVLTMNDQEAGRYTFTVAASGAAAPFDEEAFWEAFPVPDDAEIVEVVEGYDYGFVTAMIEPDLFEAYGTWFREEGWQQQAPTEAMVTLPHQLWRKDGAEFLIEIQGVDDQGLTVVWLQLEMVR